MLDSYFIWLPLFQNILCYCLTSRRKCHIRHYKISKHPMLLFKKWKTFGFPIEGIFQNILCYCLTSCYPRRKCRLYTFQNILCYCLTLLLYCQAFRLYPFQNILCYCLTFADGFRTVDTDISKHPMLLFNTEFSNSIVANIGFQNILCYCLTHAFF